MRPLRRELAAVSPNLEMPSEAPGIAKELAADTTDRPPEIAFPKKPLKSDRKLD
jgi:hypothetical protein